MSYNPPHIRILTKEKMDLICQQIIGFGCNALQQGILKKQSYKKQWQQGL
jgi:hypothetical protein